MTKRNEIAVQIMRHLCTCPSHGYSQPGRYGTSGYCEVQTDDGVRYLKHGDRDCSSGTSESWSQALRGTPWEGMINMWLATYTMKQAFLATGLFEWKPMSFMAQPGDLYLNEGKHVAMCIQNDAGGDILAEFLIDENGDIDGYPGDQTGWESRIVGYYDFPWDGILHYNGKADTEDDMTPEQAAQLQFVYDHMHWRESDHYSDLGNLVAEFPIEYETWEDGKREPLTQPLGKRIGFIDQRIHVIEENQAAIMETLEEIRDAIDMTR